MPRLANVSALLYRRICPLLTAYVMAIVTAPQARAQVPRAETLWMRLVEPTEPLHGCVADPAARFRSQASGIGLSGPLAAALAIGTAIGTD